MPWNEDPDFGRRTSTLRVIVAIAFLILAFSAVLIIVLNR
jgi:hypothetical protein